MRHGHIVNAAEDGAAGWDELQANHYNLLITEQDLPGFTGVKLIRKLRAARMVLPVVMVRRQIAHAGTDRHRRFKLRPCS